jgi:hypothetical protein
MNGNDLAEVDRRENNTKLNREKLLILATPPMGRNQTQRRPG